VSAEREEISPNGSRFKLLLVGAGGQGVLTAARFLGEAAQRAGRGVVVGQLHGMSQRGGSVSCTVLVGPGASSFIEDGGAHAVLGLEPLEVLRARPKMSAGTKVVVNLGPVVPYTLAQRGQEYPEVTRILADVRSLAPDVVEVDGVALAEVAGSRRSLNIVMLGALAGLRILPFDGEALRNVVEDRCPARYLEPNRRAFALGKQAVAP
jgi:indolepyruvate ferredoxin oxidoreductase beta subunit